jgi:L-aminopeptidase/D-esterase-like protein
MRSCTLRSTLCAVVAAVSSGLATLAFAQAPGPNNAITDVPGIRVGHFTVPDSTGATVVLAEGTNGQGVGASVTQRGGSPGTRETDLLRPENMVQIVNAVVLSGGSAYGIAAASGVMSCLEARGVGFPVGGGNVVPIVPAAVYADAGRCGGAARPDFTSGLMACGVAASGPVEQGNVGAGAGALAGNVKGGIGTASVVLDNGVIVGALVALNSLGSPYDERGDLYAAPSQLANEFTNLLPSRGAQPKAKTPAAPAIGRGTNVVVATNVALTKAEAIKVAEMADDGLARAVRPAHSPYDSDTLFAIGTARVPIASLGDPAVVLHQIGAAAADVVARAVGHAVLSSKSTACHQNYCDSFPNACRSKP